MNDWKDLYLDSKEYEWKMDVNKVEVTGIQYLHFHYRKLEPKQPTHEEIMKPIWWRCEYSSWCKITRYIPNTRYPYYINNKWVDSKWFISCESSDIPPKE